ncbi:hypothetical protein ACH4Q6_34560 [Streptomyces lydicus]
MHPTLGPDGPVVSRLGLGCMSMTGSYGPAGRHVRHRAVAWS